VLKTLAKLTFGIAALCSGDVVWNFAEPSFWRCPLVRSSKHRGR